MNVFTFVGNLVQDPRAVNTKSGKPMTHLRVAIDAGDNQTLFMNCMAFGRDATTIHTYCKKGRAISGTGKLQQHTYTTKEGEQRTEFECALTAFWFQGSGKTEDGDKLDAAPAEPEQPRFQY